MVSMLVLVLLFLLLLPLVVALLAEEEREEEERIDCGAGGISAPFVTPLLPSLVTTAFRSDIHHRPSKNATINLQNSRCKNGNADVY